MKSLVRTFVARSIVQKGVRGGSTFWLIVGALSTIGRLYKKFATKTEAITLGEQLRPGDDLLVRYPGEPNRKTRKEIRVHRQRKTKAELKFAAEVSALEAKVAAGGYGRRKAAKSLRTLLQNPPRL